MSQIITTYRITSIKQRPPWLQNKETGCNQLHNNNYSEYKITLINNMSSCPFKKLESNEKNLFTYKATAGQLLISKRFCS